MQGHCPAMYPWEVRVIGGHPTGGSRAVQARSLIRLVMCGVFGSRMVCVVRVWARLCALAGNVSPHAGSGVRQDPYPAWGRDRAREVAQTRIRARLRGSAPGR